ncbi:hypothetical protein [Neobacillus massiliamazoniensis]
MFLQLVEAFYLLQKNLIRL